MKVAWQLFAIGAALGLAACNPEPPTVPLARKVSKSMDCGAGCWDTDPNPDFPGIYLNSTITADACFGGEYDDLDEDGLGDLCEQRISDAFNPLLIYSTSDVAWGGEPAYAAMPFTSEDGTTMVRVLYMPSYYYDNGSYGPECLQGLTNWCDGHLGDSEAIIMDIRYDDDSQHWVLNSIYLSQHTGYKSYNAIAGEGHSDQRFAIGTLVPQWLLANSIPTTPGTYPGQLAYTGNGGSAPIIWVSIDKHANYATSRDCDSGGGALGFGTDNCDGTASGYMNLYDSYIGDRNVGSFNHQLMNCVPARVPPMTETGYSECYWSGVYFAGWSGIEGENLVSPGYINRLTPWGFGGD